MSLDNDIFLARLGKDTRPQPQLTTIMPTCTEPCIDNPTCIQRYCYEKLLVTDHGISTVYALATDVNTTGIGEQSVAKMDPPRIELGTLAYLR